MFLKKSFFYLIFFIIPVCISAQVVVINEVCTSPPTGPASSSINSNSLYNTDPDEQPPFNQEWIELYNPHPCNPVDIGCYTLACNMLQPASGSTNQAPNWGAFTFPAGTTIPPLGFIIIGGNYAQVPVLDFNITYYRQTSFGSQYLDGDYTRWFLRDEYGWVALYSPSGMPVDAIYWDAYGDPTNLNSQLEYQMSVTTHTSCSGTQVLSSAKNISGIEYVGACSPGTYLSFQRERDASEIWHNGPVTPTPRNCNGPCVSAPGLNFNIQNESCAGGDGSISMSITDGFTGPYTINWINPAGVHTSSVANLSSGTYIVQVVDAYNCFIVYDTVEISQLPPPTVNFTNIINETCSMQNGSAEVTVSNGNPPYTYNWSSGASSGSAVSGNLAAGTYYVTITDQLGCTASGTFTLINFPGPEISIDSINHEMCSASDGAIFTHISGGTAPFSYSWNGNTQLNSQNLTSVHEGVYTVIVTDAYGCTASASDTIENTPPPLITFTDIQADTCNKHTGSARLNISSGHPPYSFVWVNDSANTSMYVTNLPQGDYPVSVSDSFCTVNTAVNIPLIPGPSAGFSFYPPVACITDAEFRFEDQSNGDVDYWAWNFGDGTFADEREPWHTYDSIAFYNVTQKVTNDYGCVDSITKELVVIDVITLFIPNCFTPNGDGINDLFFVVGQNISEFTLYLYDRWGELIYTSKDLNEQWNGRYKGNIVAQGVYNIIVFYSEDWAGIRVVPKSAKAHVTVIR